MKTYKIGLIGKDVSKSSSQKIHEFIAKNLGIQICYEKISIPEIEFENKITDILNSFDGFNVTIPYKLSVIPYLKNLEGDANDMGAVNTVKTSTLHGYNTDGVGFELMLINANIDPSGKRVLILGGGGAGRSVACTLSKMNSQIYIYDRHKEKREDIATTFKNVTPLDQVVLQQYHIIINATGVGMHNSVGQSPICEEIIRECDTAIDLIYEPPESKFLQIARQNGKRTLNGFAMLFYQAYYADCIYFDKKPTSQEAKKLFEEFKKTL